MRVSLLKKVRSFWNAKFVRFVFVGLINTVFGYLVYLLFLAVVKPGVALGIATTIGALFNYLSTGHIVFRHSKLNRLSHFLGAYLFIYLANLAGLQGLIALGVQAPYAQALLTPVVALSSFFIFQTFVFPSRS